MIPEDYIVYLQELDSDFGDENDPKTFSKVVSRKDSKLWYQAMKEEMNSMTSNRVWELIELPNGERVIECKWLFTTKINSLGKKTRHKGRLVAKGFTQKGGNRLQGDFFSCI